MKNKIDHIIQVLNKIILDKQEQIELILATWLMGGHVLLEDVPGTGKTVLAKAFAKLCDVEFGRVQFTPDLLPSDILGSTIYDAESRKFFYRKGPIFSDFFLADEINRATPRTQAALLEAMAERQITFENKTSVLGESFFVMATQNPIENHGTFPLPEAQLDRFTIKLSLGFLSPEKEKVMIKSQLEGHPLEDLQKGLTKDELLAIKKSISKIRIDDDIIDYLLSIVQMTRTHPKIAYGVSPRASIALTKLARAVALVKGRDHVIPSDIFYIAKPILCHRIVLTEEAIFEGTTANDVIGEILKSVRAPRL